MGTVRRILVFAAVLTAAFAVMVTGGFWFLSSPDRATGFVEARLAAMAGRPVALEGAWVSPGLKPVLHLRQLEIERTGSAQTIDLHLDPAGILPGRQLIAFAGIDEAAFTYRMRGRDGSGGLPGYLSTVRDVDITQLRLSIQRPGREPALLIITEARGNLASGDFRLTAAGGRSVLHLNGSAEGLSLDGFSGEMEMHGRNFAELAAVFGLSAPDTPPFSLYGDVAHEDGIWTFSPFNGLVGDSDLAGTMSADFGRPRPRLTADLTSDNLDFDDLGVVIGAPSDIDRTTANDEQEAANRAYASSGRLIPNARLDTTRVRTADARVRFSARNVQAGAVPLSAMEIVFELDNGVMTFEPLAFETADRGRLTAYATIDARTDTVRTEAEGELDGFELASIGNGRLARGQMHVAFALAMTGADLRTAFASADGEITAQAAPGARIRHLAVEGAGLDVGEILLLRLSEDEADPGFIPVNCAGGVFRARDGRLQAENVLVDTDDSVVALDGQVSLETERLALAVAAEAKDVSWGNLLGGVAVNGTLRNPDIDVDAAPSVLQGVLAGLLGSAAGPLAVLPFTELGLGEAVSCDSLPGPPAG
ncbi:AsmA family protein [Maricaulis sp.]|uniref:AsmA family protein n=1 Tax=Maricaulis sp. TaxID=1486257 RepID=UPI00329879EA